MKQQYFSIIIDESTDLGTSKYLVLVVRFLNPKNEPVDAFLTLLEVKDGTHGGLFHLIIDYFVKMYIPYKEKMVSLASDSATVMVAPITQSEASF